MNPEGKPLVLSEELESFFSVSLDLLCVARADGYFERLSPGWERVLGYNLDTLYKIRFISLVHPDDLTRTRDRISRLAQGLEVENGFSNRYLHKKGHYITLEWSSRFFQGRIFSSARDITERLHTQWLLVNQHEQFAKALEASNAGVYDIDVTGETIGVSPNWWTILGYEGNPKSRITNAEFFDLIFPEDLNLVISFGRNVLKSGEQKFELEFRMLHAGGKVIWVLSKGTILVNATGMAYRVVGANTDITQKKEAENALAKKNQLLEMAGQFARLGYFEADIETDEHIWSPMTREILGLESSFKPGNENSFSFFKPGEHQIRARKLTAELMEQGTAFEEEFLVTLPSGTDRWVRMRAEAELVNGRCRRIFGTIQDIHPAKQKAIEELEREKQLRMLSGSNAGGWEWNIETGECYCSPRWCEILGFSQGEIKEMSLERWIGMVHPDDRHIIRNSWPGISAGNDRFQSEVRVKRKSGEWIWIQDNGKVMFDPESGAPILVYGAISDITDRKKNELSLILFQNLMDNTTDGIQIFLEDGRLIYMNLTASRRCGIAREEAHRYKAMDFETEMQEDKKWKARITRLKKAGSLVFTGIQKNRSSGESLPVEIQENYLQIDSVGYIVSASRDITERIAIQKRIDYELALQNILIRVSSSCIGIGLEQVESTIQQSLREIAEFVRAQRAFLFDFSLPTGTARKTHEWLSDPGDGGAEPGFFPSLAIPDSFRRLSNGEMLVVSGDSGPGANAGQSLNPEEGKNRSFICVPLLEERDLIGFLVLDTLEENHHFSDQEQQLLALFAQMLVNIRNRQNRERKLVVQEEKYRNILNNMNLGLLEIDQSGEIRFANLGFQRLSGLSTHDIVGRQAGRVIPGLTTAVDFSNRLQRRKKGVSDTYEIDYQHPDGTTRYWFLNASPNYNDNGVFTGSVKVFLDMTEKKKLEEEQKVLAELTRNQNQRLRNFAHIVSHNLRSHAGNLRSLMDILGESPQKPEPEVIAMAQTASRNLMETIDNLAGVAQITTFDQKEMETLDLSEYLTKALSHVSAMAMKNRVEIRNFLRGSEKIQGVPAYLESILLNLILNAIKYRDPEKPNCYIEIRSLQKGSQCLVQVEDNGLGINLTRHRAKIFGMYKTFHRLPDSKGLGLFITRNQVEAMGGSIDVESQEGVGSTFILTFLNAKI